MRRKLWPYLLLLVIVACKKDKAAGVKSVMRFTLNGEQVECNGGVGFNEPVPMNYGATIKGFHSKGFLELTVVPNYPDSIKLITYDLQRVPEQIKFVYSEGTTQWVAQSLSVNGSGSLTIEVGSRSHLKGTFSIITSKGDDGSAEKTITAGEFDVYR